MALRGLKTLSQESRVAQTTQGYSSQAIDQLTEEIRARRPVKPGFKYESTTSLILQASENRPAYFLIGDDLYKLTSNLTCSISRVGVGGLGRGTVEASAIYYLYAVAKDGQVGLVLDKESPENGLEGYGAWTYLGAVSTKSDSTLATFVAFNGKYLTSVNLSSSATHTGDTNISGQVLYAPVTAKSSKGDLIIDGSAVGSTGAISGFDDTNNMTILQSLQVNGVTIRHEVEVSLNAYNLIYLKVSNATTTATWRVHGWVEDPSEWL